MDNIEKVRENRSRRAAHRLGYELIKSRVHRASIDNHCGWRLVDKSNCVVAGEKFDMAIEDVEQLLKAENAMKVAEIEKNRNLENSSTTIL